MRTNREAARFTQTVDDTFAGDTAAFRRVNPRDILATTRFPDSAGMFVVGIKDTEFRPQTEQMYAECKKAGMRVRLVLLPGEHTWRVRGPGLQDSLPWLGTRLSRTP